MGPKPVFKKTADDGILSVKKLKTSSFQQTKEMKSEDSSKIFTCEEHQESGRSNVLILQL